MAKDMATPDAAAGNPRAASVRLKSRTNSSYSFQWRHDLRRGPQPNYVDADRSHLNRIIVEGPRPAEMHRIAQERRSRRDTRRGMKSNAAIATAGIITFGSEAASMFNGLSEDQQDAAFRELAEAVAARLNTSLHALVVHLDETTIHAHFTISSHDHDGHPLSKTTRPAVMSELQDLAAEILGRHCPGIERGHRYGDRLAAGADYADVIHKSVRQLHHELPADLAAARERLAHLEGLEASALTRAEQARADLVEVEDRLEAAEEDRAQAVARVDEMQARVDKLVKVERELTEKEAKRLRIYEKRLADRQADLETATASVVAAKSEAQKISVGLQSLAEQMNAGKLSMNDAGKVVSPDREALQPLVPMMAPAIRAVVEAKTQAEAEAKRLQKEAAGAAQKQAAEVQRRIAEAEAASRKRLDEERAEMVAEIQDERRAAAADRQEAKALLTSVRAVVSDLRAFLAEIEPLWRTIHAVKAAYGTGTQLRRRLMDVFKASERRTAGAYEGRLGVMQRDEDAKILAPVDAALREAEADASKSGCAAPRRAASAPLLEEAVSRLT